MLNDISGIKLKGGSFENLTDLNILEPRDGNKVKRVKGAIVYGRNGAGKSTIAKALKKIILGGYPDILDANVFDKDGTIINLSEDEKKHIFVFDEEFVDANVKLQDTGLNTIVMLGQQVELADKITYAQNELDIARQQYIDQENIIKNVFENRDDSKSPKFYQLKMKLALQGDDCWAGRDKIVRNGRSNTGVKDDTYKKFINLAPQKSRDELIILFDKKLLDLQKAENGDAVIRNAVHQISVTYNDSEVKEMLSMKIEEPILSDREKYLLKLIQDGKSDMLASMISSFNDENTKHCPYCLQSVDVAYKKDLVESIQKVLSKDVEEHQAKLKKLLMQEISIDLFVFVKLGNMVDDCIQVIDSINTCIRENNDKIKRKIENPYLPILTGKTKVNELLEMLKQRLQQLEDLRNEYNSKIQATDPIITEMRKINDEIAHYDIAQLAARYSIQQQEYEKEKIKLAECKRVLLQKQEAIDRLEAQRKNIQVALNVINNSLKYIFFSEDRLKIEYRDDEYVLLSNGHNVKPTQISLGERNIIALCYYFANIMQNQELEASHAQEYILLIDDPVSSFDIENKVGIMSFLKYQLGLFLLGNINTKAIVMTHDLLTFYDLNKIYEELIENCNEKFSGDKMKFNRLEMAKQNIKQFEYKNRQEYTELIKIIYKYALGEAEEYEIIIGNIIRQVLEAFSTFQYKKNIEKISTDSFILNDIPEQYRAYFNNLMYRLVLHGGSHRENQVKALDDLNFFSVISSEEKIRTAKDVLCYLYILNAKHVLSHLKDSGNNVKINLEQWCSNIKNMSVV